MSFSGSSLYLVVDGLHFVLSDIDGGIAVSFDLLLHVIVVNIYAWTPVRLNHRFGVCGCERLLDHAIKAFSWVPRDGHLLVFSYRSIDDLSTQRVLLV